MGCGVVGCVCGGGVLLGGHWGVVGDAGTCWGALGCGVGDVHVLGLWMVGGWGRHGNVAVVLPLLTA